MNAQAEEYFKRYQEATPDQRPSIAEEFQAFYNRLSASEKASVEPVLDELRHQIQERISTLDGLVARVEHVLQKNILNEI